MTEMTVSPSPFGIIGAAENQDNLFYGFIQPSGQIQTWDEYDNLSELSVTKDVFFGHGVFLIGVKLLGPTTDDTTIGKLILFTSDHKTHTFDIDCRIAEADLNPDNPWITQYHVSEPDKIIGSIGFHLEGIYGSCTIVGGTEITPPSYHLIELEGSGGIGYLIHPSYGLVGFVDDKRNKKMLIEYEGGMNNNSNNNMNNNMMLETIMFRDGQLLSALTIDRNNTTSVIEIVSQDSSGLQNKYISGQSDLIPGITEHIILDPTSRKEVLITLHAYSLGHDFIITPQFTSRVWSPSRYNYGLKNERNSECSPLFEYINSLDWTTMFLVIIFIIAVICFFYFVYKRVKATSSTSSSSNNNSKKLTNNNTDDGYFVF
jgi:hypothetical protein